jgi:glycosyltransferase involved in cell wall biosynthesis
MIQVSCIMPTTTGRIFFLPLAIAYFLRQDFVHAELVIIDDSPQDEIRNIIPVSDKIRYIHHPSRFSSVGSKRNYACAQSRGTIILHWDDDDWYASDWITRQVHTLLSNDADICGLNNLNFFNPVTDSAWHYIYNYNPDPWVAGATLAYQKGHWEKHPFKDMNVGEDNDFVWNTGARIAAQTYTDGFVSILHDNNTSPKHTYDAQWKPQSVTEIKRILCDDFFSYLIQPATTIPNDGV